METLNTKGLLPIALDAVVLECRDAAALSDFYIRLLGWKKNHVEENEWTDIISTSGGVKKLPFSKIQTTFRPYGRTS